MLKLSEIFFKRWWRFLLLGIVIIFVYLFFFLIISQELGKLFNTVYYATNAALILALFGLGLIYIFKSKNKTKKSRALWTSLFNYPLGLIALLPAFVIAGVGYSDAMDTHYKKEWKKTCKSPDAQSLSKTEGLDVFKQLVTATEIESGRKIDVVNYDQDETSVYNWNDLNCVTTAAGKLSLYQGHTTDFDVALCDLGEAQSCSNAARDLETSQPLEALKHFDRACSLKVEDSCFWLSTLYMPNKFPVIQSMIKDSNPTFPKIDADLDISLGLEYVSKSCENENILGCKHLEDIIDGAHEDKGVKVDKGWRRSYDEKRCDAGNADVCSDIGYSYYKGNDVDKSMSKSLTYFEKACDFGEDFSCTLAGNIYVGGEGDVKQISAKGFLLLNKACDNDYAVACNNIGVNYNDAVGVAKDYAVALKFAKRACKLDEQFCDNAAKTQRNLDISEENARIRKSNEDYKNSFVKTIYVTAEGRGGASTSAMKIKLSRRNGNFGSGNGSSRNVSIYEPYSGSIAGEYDYTVTTMANKKFFDDNKSLVCRGSVTMNGRRQYVTLSFNENCDGQIN
mgnify:CR=1 FL=1